LGVGRDRFGGVSCHQDAAAAMVGGANGVEYLEPVHVRQVIVKQDHFGQELVGRDHSQFAVAGDTGIPAATLEVRLQVLCKYLFVVDDQDLLALGRTCCSTFIVLHDVFRR